MLLGCGEKPLEEPGGSRPAEGSEEAPIASYREKALEATEIVEAPATGIDLGWGWNTFDSRPVPAFCIVFSEQREPAQARRMSMREVADSYEVMESMDMSAEASVKAIGVEVSGKAAFAKELNISSFASSFVLNASVDNGVRYVAPTTGASKVAESEISTPSGGSVRLTPEMAKLASRDLDEFLHQCGNGYVSAVYSGAKLTAVLTIQEKSLQQQETLSASLSGEGWGARLESSLSGKKQSGSESSRLDLSIFQVGGRGDAIPTSKQDLLDKMKDLSSLAFDAPKDFRVAISPYENLPNWPRKPIVGEEQEFEELASYWGAYNTLYDEIQTVLDDPMSFERVGLTVDAEDTLVEGQTCLGLESLDTATTNQLKAAQDEILARLIELKGMALSCTKKPGACEIDTRRFRDPYAYRAMLPVPKEAVTDVEGVVSYHIADTAKRRCAIDVQNPGCLSNAEIDAWGEKVGKFQVALGEDRVREILAKEQEEICKGTSRPSFSGEPGRGVLWYDESQQVFIGSLAKETLSPASSSANRD